MWDPLSGGEDAALPVVFTLPITGRLGAVEAVVSVEGAAVVLFLLIGWPLAYVGEKALAPVERD